MGGSNQQQMPQGMNAVGEQQYASSTVPKPTIPTAAESIAFKNQQQNQQQDQQQNQFIKDLLSKVGQTASSPYDRAAKSQSDSASAWSAMQRGSADGSGSLDFSSMGAYSVPETGEEKVSQAWADAFKSIGTSALGAYGNKLGGANKIG